MDVTSIGVNLTSLKYRQAVAGSMLEPEITINDPGAAVGLVPAPPVTAVIAGTGRAVNVNKTGATPGAEAATLIGPALGPRLDVMLATPSVPVDADPDDSVAAPCETEKEIGAYGYAMTPWDRSLTTSA